MNATPSIGVFDSGLGGLTVLRALHERLPGVNLVYVADSAHAPYGDKADAHIADRARRITSFLQQQGARLIVVACNTATAAAISELRAEFALPFVGIEPGIKPARKLSATGRIGVMATPSTLRSARFQALAKTHAADARLHLQPCAGLADAVERGDLDASALHTLLDAYCAELSAAECDVVVLGCTHYPLIVAPIAERLGSRVQLLDTAQAVAEQAARLWPALDAPEGSAPAVLRAYGGGDLAVLKRMAELTGLHDLDVQALPAL